MAQLANLKEYKVQQQEEARKAKNIEMIKRQKEIKKWTEDRHKAPVKENSDTFDDIQNHL